MSKYKFPLEEEFDDLDTHGQSFKKFLNNRKKKSYEDEGQKEYKSSKKRNKPSRNLNKEQW